MTLKSANKFGSRSSNTRLSLACCDADKNSHTRLLQSQENYKQRYVITYIYIPAKFPANCPGKTTATFNSNNDSMFKFKCYNPFVSVPFISAFIPQRMLYRDQKQRISMVQTCLDTLQPISRSSSLGPPVTCAVGSLSH